MKFRLVEDVELEESNVNGITISPNYSGQTDLKELIVNTLNDTTNFNIHLEDYVVHHLDGNHGNVTQDNICITTESNHNNISNAMRLGNWKTVEQLLPKCFTIKMVVEPIHPKKISKVVNTLKSNRKVFVDKNGDRWFIEPDNVYAYTAVPITTNRKTNRKEIPFETEDEMLNFITDYGLKSYKET